MPRRAPFEALVVVEPALDARAAARVVEEVARHARVLQAAGHRVLVIDARGAALAAVRTLPGVARVLTDDAAGEPLPRLDGVEARMAQGWRERQAERRPHVRLARVDETLRAAG